MTGKDLKAIRATSENITYQLEKGGNNQNKEDFIREYSTALVKNKKLPISYIMYSVDDDDEDEKKIKESK